MERDRKASIKFIGATLFSCACTIFSMTAGVADERRSPSPGASETSILQKGSGASTSLAQLEERYKAGDYTSAVRIGEIVVKHNAEDGVAHYYYASALAKLNRKEDALLEFRKAYNRTVQPTLKSYCEQAINALSEGADESQRAARANATGATQLQNGAAAATTLGVQAPVVKSSTAAAALQEKDLLERKATILEDGANQIDHLRQVAADDIKKLKKNVTDQMVDIPRQIRGLRGWVQNPDYAPTLARLDAEAQESIDKINDRVARETAE